MTNKRDGNPLIKNPSYLSFCRQTLLERVQDDVERLEVIALEFRNGGTHLVDLRQGLGQPGDHERKFPSEILTS